MSIKQYLSKVAEVSKIYKRKLAQVASNSQPENIQSLFKNSIAKVNEKLLSNPSVRQQYASDPISVGLATVTPTHGYNIVTFDLFYDMPKWRKVIGNDLILDQLLDQTVTPTFENILKTKISLDFNPINKVSSFKITTKIAQDQNRIAQIVKQTVKDLKSRPEMKGVFYASNVEVQNMEDHYHIAFILNVDRSDESQQYLQETRPLRRQLLQTEVAKAVRSVVSMDVTVDFNENPIDNPGWFGHEFE